MAASPKKSLALDTNLLFDLAQDQDFAHEFREEFSVRGYSFLIPPTVAAELAHFAAKAEPPHRDFATLALRRVTLWKFQPFALSSAEMAISMRFAERLVEASLLPEDELNDGRILAQTSLANIPLLVTSDKHLLDIDEDELLLSFNDADLNPVRVSHPKRLLRALR